MTANAPNHKKQYELVTDDDLYRHTSQYRIWSLTPEELEKKRQETYNRAATATRKKLAEKGISESQVDVLTYEEEQQLIQLYASKFPPLTETLQLPTQVKATALSYFRKFYLVHSVMEHHPKNILFTCLFLAAKAENRLVSIERFCSQISKTRPSDILNCEFLVLESLSFTLLVLNGYRPLRGLFLDLQTVLPDLPTPDLLRLRDDAKEVIIQSFFSDAQFHFTPPQIAMAGLLIANESVMQQYLEKKFGVTGLSHLRKETKLIDEKGVDNLQTLLQIINECKRVILSAPPAPPNNVGKEIDKKLHYCLNPEKFLNASKRKLERSRNGDGSGNNNASGSGLGGQSADSSKVASVSPDPQSTTDTEPNTKRQRLE